MTTAEDVVAVYRLMSERNVTLADLELFGHVEGFEDNLADVNQAFNALLSAGIRVDPDDRAAIYNWETQRDHVYDALTDRGLYLDEEEVDD